jgi:hypothetical protein
MMAAHAVLEYSTSTDNVLREHPLGRRWATYSRPPAVTSPSQRRNEVGDTRLALVLG